MKTPSLTEQIRPENLDLLPAEHEKELALTEQQAKQVEAELRRLEADPLVTKTELRLFLQSPMPCGHAVGNLLTCDSPPFGCVICNRPKEGSQFGKLEPHGKWLCGCEWFGYVTTRVCPKHKQPIDSRATSRARTRARQHA
jgi:hypothetical protein